MKRLKVLFYVHEWTYGGTARSHLRIMEALDKDRFESYAMYWPKGQNDLLPRLQRLLGDRLYPFHRTLEKTEANEGYAPLETNFGDVVKIIQPDIIHHARGGYFEFPFNLRHAPLQIETNIFAERDSTHYLDKSIAICKYIADRRGLADATIYNPIPPAEWGYTLRHTLNIPEDAFVCGRIGRPSNFHPIALQAFAKVVKDFPNTYYLIMGGCEEAVNWAKAHEIPNVVFLPVTVDDHEIECFYGTLDLFLHYRSDGECHSIAISQALAHGIPVISHWTQHFQGQDETIGGAGRVCTGVDEYEREIRQMMTWNKRYVWTVKRALQVSRNYEQGPIVRQIEAKYLEWAQEKGIV